MALPADDEDGAGACIGALHWISREEFLGIAVKNRTVLMCARTHRRIPAVGVQARPRQRGRQRLSGKIQPTRRAGQQSGRLLPRSENSGRHRLDRARGALERPYGFFSAPRPDWALNVADMDALLNWVAVQALRGVARELGLMLRKSIRTGTAFCSAIRSTGAINTAAQQTASHQAARTGKCHAGDDVGSGIAAVQSEPDIRKACLWALTGWVDTGFPKNIIAST